MTKKKKDPITITHPEIAVEWHPTKNGNLLPEAAKPGSDFKAWWLCSDGDCQYEWQTRVSHRTGGRGCPECSKKRGAGRHREPAIYEDSFAYQCPEIAAEWHSIKNGDLFPEAVKPGSRSKVWWRCSDGDCQYEWQARVKARTRGSGCPHCNTGWTIKNVAWWLIDNWEKFLIADKEARLNILQETGLGRTSGPGRSILEAVLVGEINQKQIRKFVDGENVKIIQELIQHHDPRDYKGRQDLSASLKRKIFERDQYRCLSCLRTENDNKCTKTGVIRKLKLHCDHIMPWSLGGDNEEENLQTLCEDCNRIKCDKIMTLEDVRAEYSARKAVEE